MAALRTSSQKIIILGPLLLNRDAFGKIIHLKIVLSDVSRMSIIFTEFTYFPQDVSETHISLHSTELQ